MAESLKLDAVVTDKFSRPLGELRAKMLAVTRTGQTGTKATSAEFERFHGNVQRVTASLRGGLEPSLAAVGLAGLGAGLAVGGVGAAIAGVVASIKKFSTSAIDMKNLSRETGVAISTIQQLQSVSEQFGAKSENIAAGLARFRSNIFDAKIGKGIIGEVSIREDGERLIKAMQEASPDKALDVALDFLEKQKGDPERQKRLANLIFGADDFQKLVQDGIPALKNAMTEAAKRLPDFSEEGLKKARGYQEAIAKLADQFEALSHKIGEITVPWLTKLIDGLDDAINKGKIFYRTMNEGAATLGDKLKAAAELDSELTPGSSGVGAATRKAIDWLKELFGAKEAGAAEAKPGEGKPGDGKPGASLPGVERFKSRDEIRVGVKEGFIEALRQMMRERVPGDMAQPRVWNASLGGRGGGGGYSAVQEGLQRHGGYEGDGDAEGAPHRRYSGGVGTHKGKKAILHGGALPAIGPAGGGSKLSGSLGERTDIAMRAAESQLLQEGVTAEHARAAAAMLIGNALGESPLNPSERHDQGTGYGIYGARNERATKMLSWLKANGYAPNSLEGQAKYMAHEAMTHPRFGPTRRALENATRSNLAEGTVTTMRNFEAPGLPTPGLRARHAIGAYDRAPSAGGGLPPNVPKPGTGYRALPDYRDFGADDQAHKPGEALKTQAASPFGPEGPVSGARTGKATMEISLKGFPAANTKADGGSLFDQIKVSRGLGMQEAR